MSGRLLDFVRLIFQSISLSNRTRPRYVQFVLRGSDPLPRRLEVRARFEQKQWRTCSCVYMRVYAMLAVRFPWCSLLSPCLILPESSDAASVGDG